MDITIFKNKSTSTLTASPLVILNTFEDEGI